MLWPQRLELLCPENSQNFGRVQRGHWLSGLHGDGELENLQVVYGFVPQQPYKSKAQLGVYMYRIDHCVAGCMTRYLPWEKLSPAEAKEVRGRSPRYFRGFQGR